MSGFVGILHRDGRPVEPKVLRQLTESLRFRGPDGLQLWHSGSIGLGHARFVTDPARDSEPMPLVLDNRYWICGHLRLDAREALIAALGTGHERASAAISDAALVLRAYRAWGVECMTRLHGEFAFAIWDAFQRRLFCARDPFGVRPFFHAALGDLFLFGNTLDCLRLHPRVRGALDEYAIADFLTRGYPLEADRSFFADIRRLPAGHTLSVTAATLTRHRYWRLPDEPCVRHRRPQQYVEQFGELLARAVRDRSGTGPIALALSGGLDSGAIAAAATGRIGRAPVESPLRAYCYGMTHVFDDPEPAFARISADALGLPLEIMEAEDDVPFRPLRGGATAEPYDDFYYTETLRWQAHVARDARVILDGLGADEIFLSEWLLDEAARESWPRLARDALETLFNGQRPGLGLRARLAGRPVVRPEPPSWLAPEWSQSLRVRERLLEHRATDVPAGTPRARARARLLSPTWPLYLESLDAGFTRVPLESRWPFLDHRLLQFALSLPPFPWCVDKRLLRAALRPVLPETIVSRPKAPLAGQAFAAFLSRNPGWPRTVRPVLDRLGPRLDVAAWQRAWRRPGHAWWAWDLARPVALGHWLKGLELRDAGVFDGGPYGSAGFGQEGRSSAAEEEEVREALTQ